MSLKNYEQLPILSYSFRPFFLLAALMAIMGPLILVLTIVDILPFEGHYLNAYDWHGHEMMYGFTSALLTGFLLTASASWTGTKPVSGKALFLLVIVWLSARLFFGPLQLSPILLYLFGPLPFILLIFHLTKILKGNRNRYPILILLTLLTISEILYLFGKLTSHDDITLSALTVTKMVIFFFLFIFSGRLIPFFTNSYFKKPIIKPLLKFDLALGALSFFLFMREILQFEQNPLINSLFFLTSFLFLLRGIHLFYAGTLKVPMLWVLHLAHLWFPIYFVLMALENMHGQLFFGRAAFHSLLSGALLLFSLGIMSRAGLGHTGRKIKATPTMILTFILVFLGSLSRSLFSSLIGEIISPLLLLPVILWSIGLMLFLWKFTPIFFKKRLDQV